MSLEDKESAFQKEAQQIIKDLKLPTLSQYGKFEIVGSMAIHTMLYPDIDITIRSTPENESGYWQTVQSLLKHPKVEKLILIDTRNRKLGMYPRGLYINCIYNGEKIVWNLDIWFFRILRPDEQNNNEWLKKNMTEEQREIILILKAVAIKSGKYKTHIFSMDIYDSVIKHGVKDKQGFKNYLKTIGKTLD